MTDAPPRTVIPRKFYADQGPWLIWSCFWGRWHRRDPKTGGASGYTDDIAKAGVFGYEKALAYHETGRARRNAAVPVCRVIPQLRARLSGLTAEQAALHDLIERLSAATPDGGD